MEVCAVDIAGGSGYVVSVSAFQARGGGCMMCRRSCMDFSFAPSGLEHSLSSTHGLRRGLHSFAASRLAQSRPLYLFARRVLASLLVLVFIGLLPVGSWAQGGGQLRFCLRAEPKTFDPLKVEDDASVSIRYLTVGVRVRLNRQTMELGP